MWLKLIKNPILFQGRNKRKSYFEGWYFKQVSQDLKTTISLIPGISFDERDPHCFIQVIVTQISGTAQNMPMRTEYFRFPHDAFTYQDEPFAIQIADNHFSKEGIFISLESEQLKLQGQVKFGTLRGIETSMLHPNIMGYYAYIPRMECYHGIVSMTHLLEGSLELGSETISFTSGKGYIEKDWGSSFPGSYLWLQSNHFDDPEAALMCSVAHIPFLGSSFKGFICNLSLGEREYRFASYNNSKLELHEFTPTRARLTMKRKDLLLKLDAQMEIGALLQAPLMGAMSLKIKEGLSGIVTVTLQKSSGEILFDSIGSQCGIELMPEGGM